MEAPATLGIIAGNGLYPATMARAARKAGVKSIVVAAFVNETEASLASEVDHWEWMRVGQLGRMIKFFQRHGAQQAVMVGQIAPRNLFDLRPDLRTLLMLGRLKRRNAETIFGAIGNELAKDGITLISAVSFLEDLLPGPGPVCGRALKARELADAEFGVAMAKEMSRMDIGQTVVVKKGTVLAVEAFEGTNECIKRGGALGRGGATVAKVSKPNQDFRFDVPVVGPATIATCAAAGVRILAIEARRTLLLGMDEVRRLCAEHDVSIHALEAPDI